MKTVVIVQARMASSRLPGKVLLEIGGKPMLGWVLERAARARRVDAVMVATTTDPSDDAIVSFCKQGGWAYSRGSLYDVLDRYYQAARAAQADVIVRVTADCPLTDPALIDEVLDAFTQSGVDFAANRLPPPWQRTYPIGLDIEVCSFVALERAWREAVLPHEREHVMPYLYDQPERFKTLLLNTEPDTGSLRWTVDTPADLEFVRALVGHLGGRDDFTWQEALAVVHAHPELAQINAQVRHKQFDEIDHRATGEQ